MHNFRPNPAAPATAGTALPREPLTAMSVLMERVTRTAELVAGQPAERVNMRLELPGLGTVDLQVAMRDGQVQTSFRSDSAEVRAALASGWGDFVGGREATGHVWAEPVIAPLVSATVPASGGSGFASPHSGLGEDSHQHQQPAADSMVGLVRGLGLPAGQNAAAPLNPVDSTTPTSTRLLQASA